MIIYKKDIMPDFMFRDLTGDEIVEFTNYARNPENQTEENLKKATLYHPVVRAVWVELGLITILENDPDA